jgi:hypothetical protein
MRALKSPLAKQILRAGICVTPGVPFIFRGQWYVPKIVPKPN